MKTFAIALLALLVGCGSETPAPSSDALEVDALVDAAPDTADVALEPRADVAVSDVPDIGPDATGADAASDGAVCDADTRNDPMNCGRCGNACPLPPHLQRVFCTRGECDFTGACVSGYANCDGVNSNGCETPTLDDPRHCGGCGFVADQVCTAPTPMCVAGRCSACPAGLRSCRGGSVCSDLTTDNNNCGDCTIVCGAGTHCVGALCVPL